ncbi:MAG: hypothetical protein ACXVZQ_08110, partial [Terriglobales bacterium]
MNNYFFLALMTSAAPAIKVIAETAVALSISGTVIIPAADAALANPAINNVVPMNFRMPILSELSTFRENYFFLLLMTSAA